MEQESSDTGASRLDDQQGYRKDIAGERPGSRAID
jgi:hypothetical protein